ncbi:hypothetical protein BST61_g6670 [Cercospora zeina]
MDRVQANQSADDVKTIVNPMAEHMADDEVLRFIILSPPSTVEIDTDTYRPPHVFQISSGTRAIAAEHYYSQMAFTCAYAMSSLTDTAKWLRSIPAQHRAFISKVQIRPDVHSTRHSARGFKEWRLCTLYKMNARLSDLQYEVVSARLGGTLASWEGVEQILFAVCPLEEEGEVINMEVLSTSEIEQRIKEILAMSHAPVKSKDDEGE